MAKVLPDGEEIGQDLGGMELIGQAVPHRHTGVVGKVFHDLLAIAAVLDAVVHAAENAGGVLDGLLLAHLGALGVKVGDAHAQVHGAHLEGAAGARGGLLEEKDDVLALQVAVRLVVVLLGLEVDGEVNEVLNLIRGKVQELEEVPAGKVGCHG